MIRGLYTAASGMNVQQSKMDVVTHNLSNIDTAGYKKEQVIQSSFAEILVARSSGDEYKNLKALGISGRGAILEDIVRDFSQGPLKQTGKNTDLALSGEGFFTIQKKAGEVYTRDGNFTLDRQGCLVTAKGDPVLGRNGRIYLDGDNFSVKPDGAVIQNGQIIDRLKIISFDNLKELQKDTDNCYRSPENSIKTAAGNFSVRQCYLEGTNIVLVDEMVKMIEVSKSYESSQRIIQTQDQLLGKAVNEVGNIK